MTMTKSEAAPSAGKSAESAEHPTTKTLTLRDIAPNCKYCGKPIEWKKSATGKFAPIEPVTGFDHRERCNGMNPATRANIRTTNHERAVKKFFALGAST
jgi:hypothetical protein